MDTKNDVSRRDAMALAGMAGLAAFGLPASAEDRATEENEAPNLATTDLETFRAPPGARAASRENEVQQFDVTNVVSVASQTFTFKKNQSGGGVPGQTHEDSRVISIPSGAGFFVCTNYLTGAFTRPNFATLIERPLGQFMISAGLRGNNLVCRVRLTDINQDDPIFIETNVLVVFFR